ncbi:MAG: DUF2183 domain-containing protein [Propionibacteriaceae bacterium]|nr:DUF2183 domain-containing protein [Propionibacteriaceae bacterium]
MSDMSDRPFWAARVETALDRGAERMLRRWGWHDCVIGFTGYGSTSRLRVLARIILTSPSQTVPGSFRSEAWNRRRGWRNLWATPCVERAARLRVGDVTVEVTADRGGYIDARVDCRLSPGWHHVAIDTASGQTHLAPVLILADDTTSGLISDVDDTILQSLIPRPLLAARNAFLTPESDRRAVPGMARLYRQILSRRPDSPTFYLSTGSWSTFPFLTRFTDHHGFPGGPMLLSDWGPTNTGWFPVGRAHKIKALSSLAHDFPRVRWILVGDDGQHDPAIYAGFAQRFPDQVEAIAIRQLNPVQSVLAHGLPGELLGDARRPAAGAVPWARGSDGDQLWAQLEPRLRPAD